MNGFAKGALIFVGGAASGFIFCGIVTFKLAMKSNTVREAIKDKISKEVTNFLCGEEVNRYCEHDVRATESVFYDRRFDPPWQSYGCHPKGDI